MPFYAIKHPWIQLSSQIVKPTKITMRLRALSAPASYIKKMTCFRPAPAAIVWVTSPRFRRCRFLTRLPSHWIQWSTGTRHSMRGRQLKRSTRSWWIRRPLPFCRRATSAWWSSTITTRRSGTWPMCRIFSRTLLMCLWLSWMRTTVLPLKTWSLIRAVALTDQWCTMLAMDSLPTISKTIILAQCFMWAMYRMFTSLFSLSMCSSPRSS